MKKDLQSSIRASLLNIHGRLESDILAECFAEMLISSGHFSEEQIHLLPKDQFKRNYSNDITRIELDEDLITKEESDKYETEQLLKISTSRSSILDNLPETFYIDPFEEEAENAYQQEDQILQKRARQQKILDSANRFFKPLEVAYNRVRIRREREEVKLLEKYDDLLREFWKNISDATPAWDRFLRSLHLVSYVVGNKAQTKALIEFVLEKPVELSEHIEDQVELPKELKSGLGDIGLGYNFNVGNVIPSYIRIITLRICNLNPEEFQKYYDEQSSEGRLLQELAKYYFPLDVDIKFDYRINPENEAFSFGKGDNAILGFSSKI